MLRPDAARATRIAVTTGRRGFVRGVLVIAGSSLPAEFGNHPSVRHNGRRQPRQPLKPTRRR